MPADQPGGAAAGIDRPSPLHPPRDDRQRIALAAVVAVAGEQGLATGGAGIWRAGSAVLIGLPAVPALARVDDPARAADAERQVRVAAVLADLDVDAVRTIGPPAQPVTSAAGPVTVWAWEPPAGPAVEPEAMGVTARRLHDATRALGATERRTLALPDHDPLAAVGVELDRAAGAGATAPGDLDLLRATAGRLAATWPDPGDDPLGAALVHGDLHRANVVPGRRGPVLADLELAGWGGASADVAPQVVAVRRYGADPADLERFLAGYDADPRGWPGLDVLVDAYELWVTAWATANRTASSLWDHEADVRLQYWRTGTSSDWSLG